MQAAQVAASALIFAGVMGMVLFGRPLAAGWLSRRERHYARALNDLFILEVAPRSLVWASGACAAVAGCGGEIGGAAVAISKGGVAFSEFG